MSACVHPVARTPALLASQLTHLTLHGTPLREKKHYRNFVIATVPWLKNLDFSSVTRRDIEMAIYWRKMTKVKFGKQAPTKPDP